MTAAVYVRLAHAHMQRSKGCMLMNEFSVLAVVGGCLQVRSCGEESNVFKRVLVESSKWEMARAPNEVGTHTT